MDSPPLPNRSASGSKKHSRNVSYNRTPIARHITKGPLDADDPPAPEPSHLPTTGPLSADAVNVPIPSTPLGSPDKPSSQRTTTTTTTTQQKPNSAPPLEKKDFSFLLRPSLYHPLPPPLSLLSQPPPHLSPPNTPLSHLLSTHNYHAAAIHSANRLSTPPPPPPQEIFSLFYTRLASLCLLNLPSLAAEESRILEDGNISGGGGGGSLFRVAVSSTRDEGGTPATTRNILPWELRVLCARLASLAHGGDMRRGIAAHYELAREARGEVKRAGAAGAAGAKAGEERRVWRERLRELGLGVASVMVEGGDIEGAGRVLEGLRRGLGKQGERGEGDGGIMAVRLALVYLSLGDVDAARRSVDGVGAASATTAGTADTAAAASILPTLVDIARGDYPAAITALRHLSSSSSQMVPQDLITQNLAICLFYTGKVDEAIDLLEGLVEKGRGFHALTFNLATCFELRGEAAGARKRELAGRVTAGMGARGEGGGGAFKL